MRGIGARGGFCGGLRLKDQGSRVFSGDCYKFLAWGEGMNGSERVMSGKKGSKRGVINVCIYEGEFWVKFTLKKGRAGGYYSQGPIR